MRDWINWGVIEATISSHCHPLVVVRKKDTNKIIIYLYLMALNEHVLLENLKVECIHDLFFKLAGAQIFTTLDMSLSCHQI